MEAEVQNKHKLVLLDDEPMVLAPERTWKEMSLSYWSANRHSPEPRCRIYAGPCLSRPGTVPTAAIALRAAQRPWFSPAGAVQVQMNVLDMFGLHTEPGLGVGWAEYGAVIGGGGPLVERRIVGGGTCSGDTGGKSFQSCRSCRYGQVPLTAGE